MSIVRKKRFPAEYVDGQTAKIWPVTIEFRRRTLVVFDEEEQRLTSWRMGSIVRAHPKAPHMPVRLQYKKTRDSSRLTLSDAETLAAFMQWNPRPFHEGFSFQSLVRVAAALGFITTITVLVLYLSIPRMAKPIANMISPNMEARIGESSAKALTKDWAICTEKEGMAAVDAMVQRLSRGRDDGYDLKVIIVDVDEMNAFALPGGFIYVTSGLIKFMQSPEELAGVLAHEIGHVALKHPLEGTLSQMGVVFFLSVLTAGRTGDVMGLGATFAIVSYTRDYEQQADVFGLTLLEKAEVNAEGYADLFSRFDILEKMTANKGGVGLTGLLRTHPYSAKRAARARAESQKGLEPVLSQEQWKAVKALCSSIQEKESGLNGRVDKGEE